MSTSINTSMVSTGNIASIAKIAAFGTLAAVLVMMAFVTVPAHAQQVGLLNVKIRNLNVNVTHIKVIVKDVLNHNQIIYVKNVQVLSGNQVVLQIPVTISGNSVNVCAQALNVANGIVSQQCQAVAFGDTYVKNVAFTFR
jgi:hypothetical protein